MDIPEEIRAEAQAAFADAEPLVTSLRAHAFDLIQNRSDEMDDVEIRLDMSQHFAQAIYQAPNASAAMGFLIASIGEAIYQLAMSDHAAFQAMLDSIEGLPTIQL